MLGFSRIQNCEFMYKNKMYSIILYQKNKAMRESIYSANTQKYTIIYRQLIYICFIYSYHAIYIYTRELHGSSFYFDPCLNHET